MPYDFILWMDGHELGHDGILECCPADVAVRGDCQWLFEIFKRRRPWC